MYSYQLCCDGFYFSQPSWHDFIVCLNINYITAFQYDLLKRRQKITIHGSLLFLKCLLHTMTT